MIVSAGSSVTATRLASLLRLHVALSLLTLVPGHMGGSETYVRGLLDAFAAGAGPDRVTVLAGPAAAAVVPAHGPVTAAIANAVFDCLGVRVRKLPITRDSLIAAIELAS